MLEDYIVVDLEMTGLRSKTDKILEIGAVKVRDGKMVAQYQTLVNPNCSLSEEVTKLTGITQEMAATGMEQKQAIEEMIAFGEELPLVGHNLIFDYAFLKQSAVNLGIPYERKGVDTLKIARKYLVDAEKKSLDYLCEYLHIIRPHAHRALDDAKATQILLEYLKNIEGVTQEQDFVPGELVYKVKKQGPITKNQKVHLKELLDYHKIVLGTVSIDQLTRSEASRMIDKIIAKHGHIPKR